MTDLRPTIIPKSDQLNADDLLGGPLTVKITKVYANPGSAEQPIAISFDGDGGKPYLPCKSMRRVLVNTWGHDGNTFVGRSMTLYRDDKVMFGGLAVGGIRISHLSHIDKEVTMALTATRANRKPFTVKPLAEPPMADSVKPKHTIRGFLETLKADVATAKAAPRAAEVMDRVLCAEGVMRAKEKFTGQALLDLNAIITDGLLAVTPLAPPDAGDNLDDELPEIVGQERMGAG